MTAAISGTGISRIAVSGRRAGEIAQEPHPHLWPDHTCAYPATGHSVLTVSGLIFGTRAAGECLIDAACLQSAERSSTGDWAHRNLQIVVSAAVMGEDSGAP